MPWNVLKLVTLHCPQTLNTAESGAERGGRSWNTQRCFTLRQKQTASYTVNHTASQLLYMKVIMYSLSLTIIKVRTYTYIVHY